MARCDASDRFGRLCTTIVLSGSGRICFVASLDAWLCVPRYAIISFAPFSRSRIYVCICIRLQRAPCNYYIYPQGDNRIDVAEWRFLISGMSPGQSQLNNPDPAWIEVNVWGEITALCGLDYFQEFAAMFAQRTVAWRRLA